MSVASVVIRIVDYFYISPFGRVVPKRIFRYGVCGLFNMVMDAVWYFCIYHFVVCKRFIDLGIVVISPHIMSLIVVFPITFFTGFWLNRNVAFCSTNMPERRQLRRYVFTVTGSVLLNYICMKLLVEQLGMWATPSKIVTMIICVVYSYLVGRYYTFAHR